MIFHMCITLMKRFEISIRKKCRRNQKRVNSKSMLITSVVCFVSFFFLAANQRRRKSRDLFILCSFDDLYRRTEEQFFAFILFFQHFQCFSYICILQYVFVLLLLLLQFFAALFIFVFFLCV